LETLAIAEDRRDGQLLFAREILDDTIVLGWIAVDRRPIPAFGVSDVVDADVVVRAPEEWYGVVLLVRAEHITRGGFALSLRHDPVLDANRGATVRIWPARN